MERVDDPETEEEKETSFKLCLPISNSNFNIPDKDGQNYTAVGWKDGSFKYEDTN